MLSGEKIVDAEISIYYDDWYPLLGTDMNSQWFGDMTIKYQNYSGKTYWIQYGWHKSGNTHGRTVLNPELFLATSNLLSSQFKFKIVGNSSGLKLTMVNTEGEVSDRSDMPPHGAIEKK
jgi:hypothetical protein